MLIEEKRNMVHEFCRGTECDVCPLRCGGWETSLKSLSCLRIAFSPKKDIDRAIEIIEKFKKGVADTVSSKETINSPSHYADGKIEVIDFIEDKNLGFCLGNAVKYIARAGKKDPTKTVEDLKKAEWYIKRRIKEIEEGIV